MSKVRRVVTGLAAAGLAGITETALRDETTTSGTAWPEEATFGAPPPGPSLGVEPQEQALGQAPPHETPDWRPVSETSTVTHHPDGSVGASTDTTWRPENAPPGVEVPTIEEFERIDVREDAFGNFIVDATERIVVHDHGRDKVYEDHQHIIVPGDGTPGDTDLDVFEDERVVVHQNHDGTISVDESHDFTFTTHPDAPGHGDIEVWQTEDVTFARDQRVGVSESEQATVDGPFGDPDTVHQDERAGSDPAALAGPPRPRPEVSQVSQHETTAEPEKVEPPREEPHHDQPEYEQPRHEHDDADLDPAPVHEHLEHGG